MSRRQDYLRRVIFRPYSRGAGPTFSLTLWDTHTVDELGKPILRYRLNQCPGQLRQAGEKRVDAVTLFEGDDFACSPMYAIDSDATVKGLMTFLTLRPGDADAEYFANYTPAQMEYVRTHAEALATIIAVQLGE